MMNPYDDIINLPRHTSKSRPHMSAHDRAAQFSPFAALTGYDSAITETGRLTDNKVELDEYSKADLNEKLSKINGQIDEQPQVSITYFRPDKKKAGGTYITATGVVKKINPYERTVVMQDATMIPMDDISEIDGAMFGTFKD
ncbi:MAG: hypothetical protein DDT34_00395 [Firmicutes bacterium]|nr:hypothetical protein [Bacillota bacterium]MBT9157783.1 hypothetical protein [Bacillota bacterium]